MCDLGLKIEGTILEERIAKLEEELEYRELVFRPHYYLADEWFSPDGVPGVAIPFYLAHPRLLRLERKQMLEVEGGPEDWCMKILRHEAGHALQHAYRLERRQTWQRFFGKASLPYPEVYQPKPYSKRFVLHIDSWYAQSHPTEDFAETFAVWLTPGSQWRRRYQEWPALKKLLYVDELMSEIGPKRPLVVSRRKIDSLADLTQTLREHYEERQKRYGAERPEFYDRDLRRLFAEADGHAPRETAADFLRKVRSEIRQLVSHWTGVYQYTIDQVLREMIDRCETLDLRVSRPHAELRLEAAILLTVQTMNYLHSGRHRVAL